MANGDKLDFTLGSITSQLVEVGKRLDKNDIDHEKIIVKVEDLNVWRWKTTGIASAIGTLLGFLLNKFF